MSFWPLLVLQVVIFIALVVVLRRILSHNLTDATAHLQGLNAEYARRHEELKRRIEEAESQYREQMSRARTEADQLIAKAKQEADASRVRLLEEARTESERIVQQGLESRDALRKEIEQTLDARAIEQACLLVEQSLPESLRQDIQARWLEELLHNGAAPLDRLKADEAIKEVRVVSAFPLSPAQRETLAKRLRERLGRDCTLVEHTDPRLVAGLTLTLGSVVLDGSLGSKIRLAARQAQQRNTP